MMTASGVIRILVTCVVAFVLTGCSMMAKPVASQKTIADFYCGTETRPGAYVPVRWSKLDTDETIAQTKANNAVYVEICR